jgi:hypothetical protein
LCVYLLYLLARQRLYCKCQIAFDQLSVYNRDRAQASKSYRIMTFMKKEEKISLSLAQQQ